MKKLLTLLLIIVYTTINSQTEIRNLDKWTHVAVCYGISQTTYKIFEDKKQAFIYAFLVPMAVGTAKEWSDYLRGGQFSLPDLKADLIGSLAGAFTYKVIINFKQRKKGDYSAWDKKKIYGYNY